MEQSRQEQERILRLAARDAGIPANAIGDAARRGLAKFAGETIDAYWANDFMKHELKVTAPHLYLQGEPAAAPSQGGTSAPAPAPRGDTAGLVTSWEQARERRRPLQEYHMTAAERAEYNTLKERSDAEAMTYFRERRDAHQAATRAPEGQQ